MEKITNLRQNFSAGEENVLPGFVKPTKSIQHKVKRIIKQEQFRKRKERLYSSLTDREREVLLLVVTGNNNPAISVQLSISRCTVEQHRKNINRKLGTRDLTGLFQYGLAYNLI